METQQVDVVVVGLGPGGESAATQLAEAGLNVVGIDERLVGGECPYFGCIPSKMIIRAADAYGEARRVPEFGGASQVEPDWGPVHARIRDEATTDWDDAVAVERLQKAGVTFVRGHGRLAGSKAVEVGEHRFEASKGVLVNPGTRPAAPPIDGLADTPYWTNREILKIDTLPASLAVIGGGPIGVELAQAIGRFGVRVTVIEGGDHLLGPDEPEAGELLEKVLAAEGVQVLTGVKVGSVAYVDGHFDIALADEGAGDQTVTADKLLVAAGRQPNLDDLGLDTVGLDPDARSLETDDRMQVQEGLWAIGDVTGHGAFTHMSMYEAGVAVAAVLGKDGPGAEYRAVPHTTFTDPEVGGVGMTEKQAREAGIDVAIGHQDLATNTRGWIAKAQGFVKLVLDVDRGVLVGGTVVAPGGGEILGMITLAVHAEVPLDRLRTLVGAYPTLHRGVAEAIATLP